MKRILTIIIIYVWLNYNEHFATLFVGLLKFLLQDCCNSPHKWRIARIPVTTFSIGHQTTADSGVKIAVYTYGISRIVIYYSRYILCIVHRLVEWKLRLDTRGNSRFVDITVGNWPCGYWKHTHGSLLTLFLCLFSTMFHPFCSSLGFMRNSSNVPTIRRESLSENPNVHD